MIWPGLANVRGSSMAPTIKEGDFVLVLWGARPRVGKMAIVQLPPDEQGAARPKAVKRVTGKDPADPSRWWVERDNPRAGVDSWLVGSLADDAMLARVLLRIPCRRSPFA